MLKSLAYGNYSVPLVVEDQQGGRGEEDLVFVVTVCDCDGRDTCRGKLPASTGADPSLIGLACGALLLFRKSAIICFNSSFFLLQLLTPFNQSHQRLQILSIQISLLMLWKIVLVATIILLNCFSSKYLK